MNHGGIQKISIFSPSDGTVVQFNKIANDGDFKNEPYSVEKANGSKSFSGDNYLFKFSTYDLDGYEQLQTWMKSHAELNLVAYGIDTHIMWRANTLLTVETVTKFKVGDLEALSITFKKEGGILPIYSGVNILKEELGWADSNSNGKVDNYDLQPSNLSTTFLNGVQTCTGAVGAMFGELSKMVVFPIAGAKLRVRVPATTSLQTNVEVKCYGFTNNQLSVAYGTHNSNVDFTTPAGTYRIGFSFDFEFMSAGQSLTITQPYLGVQNYESA